MGIRHKHIIPESVSNDPTKEVSKDRWNEDHEIDDNSITGAKIANLSYGKLTDLPASFPPAAHGHSIADVSGLAGMLDGKQPLATVLTNTTASFTTAQETKLAGIATAATANQADAFLLDRANHTGTQLASTISDFPASARAQVEGALVAGANVTLTPSGTGATRQITVATTGGGGSPGGATGKVQFNNAGAFGGAADAEIEGGQLRLPAIATPSAPAAGGIKLINWSQIGQADALAAMFSDGRVRRLQEDLADFQDFRFVPTVFNGAALTGDGTLPLAATGTSTSVAVGNTNIWDKMPRVDARVTTASATAVAGYRRTAGFVTVGKVASSPGGFYSRILWGPGRDYTLPSTHRACCGMLADTAAPTNVEPSTLLNGIWMGWNAADANVQIMHNDGTGAATKIDLGSAFPVPGSTADGVYMLELYSPNSLTQSVAYLVTLFNTASKTPAQQASGVITTDLPATSQFLAPRVWCSVGGTSSQVSTSLFGMHIRTEY